MASPSNTPPNMNSPKYFHDFTKALAVEVRTLLAEVGQLRDERRALQYEIAELMSLKSKHGAGGEYAPDWQPPVPVPQVEAPPPPAAIEGAPPVQAKPGWRVVHRRPERKEPRKIKGPPAAAPATVPAATPTPATRPDLPAWAQWRPNPLLAPTPVVAPTSTLAPSSPPPKPGLFGDID